MASAGGLALVGKVGAAAPTPAIETWRGITLGARASITICHTDAASARRLMGAETLKHRLEFEVTPFLQRCEFRFEHGCAMRCAAVVVQ